MVLRNTQNMLNQAGPYIPMNSIVTIFTLNIQTDKPEQIVQTQIRLLLKEQSDQGLHYLLFYRYL